MRVEGNLENDDESDRVVMVLKESPKAMTKREFEHWTQILERNMCPADYEKDYVRGKN